ncbi:MAG: hypothetical protein ACYS22_14875 [Planctomycetota bacterium]
MLRTLAVFALVPIAAVFVGCVTPEITKPACVLAPARTLTPAALEEARKALLEQPRDSQPGPEQRGRPQAPEIQARVRDSASS